MSFPSFWQLFEVNDLCDGLLLELQDNAMPVITCPEGRSHLPCQERNPPLASSGIARPKGAGKLGHELSQTSIFSTKGRNGGQCIGIHVKGATEEAEKVGYRHSGQKLRKHHLEKEGVTAWDAADKAGRLGKGERLSGFAMAVGVGPFVGGEGGS